MLIVFTERNFIADSFDRYQVLFFKFHLQNCVCAFSSHCLWVMCVLCPIFIRKLVFLKCFSLVSEVHQIRQGLSDSGTRCIFYISTECAKKAARVSGYQFLVNVFSILMKIFYTFESFHL